MTEQAFTEIFAHRVDVSTRRESRGWVTFATKTSVQTLGKFVQRAKAAGFRSAFCRPGVVGVLAADLD